MYVYHEKPTLLITQLFMEFCNDASINTTAKSLRSFLCNVLIISPQICQCNHANPFVRSIFETLLAFYQKEPLTPDEIIFVCYK